MTTALPTKRAILARGLRCRCPACGEGRIFVRRFESADRCAACGFRLERGPGHFIGGAEVNLLVTFPVCVALLAVPTFVGGGGWTMAAVGAALATIVGIAIHRPSRGVFFAIDYLVEPNWVPGGPDDGSPRRDDSDDDPRGDSGRDPDDLPPAPPVGPAAAPDDVVRRVPVVVLPVPMPAPRPDAEPTAVPNPTPPTAPRPAPGVPAARAPERG